MSEHDAADHAIDLADVRAAAERIAGHVHRTPVMTSETLDRRAGKRLFFKCENLQKVGAFKARGATNAVLALDDGAAAAGVVTHSSGNHAQALARAARLRGIAAHIVMPRTAPAVKRRAVEGYGATVVPCEPNAADRERICARIVRETGAVLIHPYDHPPILAGQGTVALELMQQVEGLDAIVAPVGGGGLISGVALTARALDPRVRVFGAEPLGADDAARSRAQGRRLPQDAPDTIADGLRTGLGELTWPVVRDVVDDVLTVDDGAIVDAMRWLWERMKIVVEPSGAIGLAVVLSDRFRALDGIERVGVVLSGGNVDLDHLPW